MARFKAGLNKLEFRRYTREMAEPENAWERRGGARCLEDACRRAGEPQAVPHRFSEALEKKSGDPRRHGLDIGPIVPLGNEILVLA